MKPNCRIVAWKRRDRRAGNALEIGIAEDHAHGFGVGLAEPEPPGFFVQRGLGDGLLQHLAIEAEGAGLIHRQGTAELTADLLQLLGIELAELFGRNLGAADRGQRRLSKPLKMSAMPQTAKLMINTPMTTAMMVLPSQFDEALRIPRSMGPTCFAGGNRSRPRRIRNEFRERASPS